MKSKVETQMAKSPYAIIEMKSLNPKYRGPVSSFWTWHGKPYQVSVLTGWNKIADREEAIDAVVRHYFKGIHIFFRNYYDNHGHGYGYMWAGPTISWYGRIEFAPYFPIYEITCSHDSPYVELKANPTIHEPGILEDQEYRVAKNRELLVGQGMEGELIGTVKAHGPYSHVVERTLYLDRDRGICIDYGWPDKLIEKQAPAVLMHVIGEMLGDSPKKTGARKRR
jgi:hypothetical protein